MIGGFTRRAGISETQMKTWVQSRPDCAFVNGLMQGLTNVNYQTSEQHKEMGKSRYERDWKDTEQVEEFFNQTSPFFGM